MTNNPQIVEKLRSLITDGDEVDRCYAIRTLHTIQDTSSTDVLIQSMRDDDIDVCVDAIEALGELGNGDELVAEKLIDSLVNDPEGEIKVACVKALADLGDARAATELLNLAEKPTEESSFVSGDWDLWWDMQLAAIRGLGKMQLSEAIPVFKRILAEDDCLDIESEVFNSLAEIGCNESNHEANDYLLECFISASPRTRRRIAKALGRSSNSSTLKPLARGLQDKDSDVRVATLHALQERKATQYLPAILLSFRDTNSDVRKVSVEVALQLSQQLKQKGSNTLIHHEDLMEKLLPLLHDTDPTVKAVVLDTLTNLGWKADDENREYLSTLLRECSGDCFASVCRVIDTQQLTGCVATLLFMFRHKELGREEEVHALTTIGRSKQWNSVIESTLGASIFSDEKMVRLTALEALSELDKSFPQMSDDNSEHSSDKESRLPLDMITEALQGQLKPPLTQKIIPIVPVQDVEKKFESQTKNGIEEEVEKIEEAADTSFVDNALEQITKSIADGEKPHPMSTLDAIAITSVEKQQQAKDEQEPDTLEKLAEDDEELQDFMELTEQNRSTSKWLFNRESVDVSVDIQRLAARMLGKAGTHDAFPALMHAFESDDSELKREAALSMGVLIEKGVMPAEELKPALHKALLNELNAKERDLRIAAARALGEFGEAADIPHLVEKLQDVETAMRVETVHSLSKIAMRVDEKQNLNYQELAELILAQLDNGDIGVHRAVVDALVPLFGNKLNGSAVSLKQAAINSLINAGLSGSHGQVKEMSWGLNALDKELSSTRLLEIMDEVTNSVDRRFVVEMLGELYRPLN